ncbi:unnamed protein product [Cochlearia groenlandica]
MLVVAYRVCHLEEPSRIEQSSNKTWMKERFSWLLGNLIEVVGTLLYAAVVRELFYEPVGQASKGAYFAIEIAEPFLDGGFNIGLVSFEVGIVAVKIEHNIGEAMQDKSKKRKFNESAEKMESKS